jgi:hypothetical protein
MGLDEEPPEVLVHRARHLIERFKTESAGFHAQSAATGDTALHVANDLLKLRDAVDREIDRRLDADLADTVCDLLEHLSNSLHAEAGSTPQRAVKEKPGCAPDSPAAAAERRLMTAQAAYLRAEQRHFEPGHDVEDWLAAENALESRPRPNPAP